jgi:hypothetical protein
MEKLDNLLEECYAVGYFFEMIDELRETRNEVDSFSFSGKRFKEGRILYEKLREKVLCLYKRYMAYYNNYESNEHSLGGFEYGLTR